MERTNEKQFRIVSRNDEIPDPVVVIPERRMRERQDEGERVILEFFNSAGLISPHFDEEKFDVRFLKKDLKFYRQKLIEENAGRTDMEFMGYLTIGEILDYCHSQLSAATKVVKGLKGNEEINALKEEERTLEWNNAFAVAGHWLKIDAVLHRAFPVPQKKLLRIKASITNVQDTEPHRQAVILQLPAANSQLNWC